MIRLLKLICTIFIWLVKRTGQIMAVTKAARLMLRRELVMVLLLPRVLLLIRAAMKLGGQLRLSTPAAIQHSL